MVCVYLFLRCSCSQKSGSRNDFVVDLVRNQDEKPRVKFIIYTRGRFNIPYFQELNEVKTMLNSIMWGSKMFNMKRKSVLDGPISIFSTRDHWARSRVRSNFANRNVTRTLANERHSLATEGGAPRHAPSEGHAHFQGTKQPKNEWRKSAKTAILDRKSVV